MEIEINSLSFTYPSGVRALNDVNLHINTGESIAIVGQNGAGKTTLVKHFNGLLKPGSGSLRVGGWDTRSYSTAKLAARVGYVFQNPDEQLFQKTVWEEMMFGPRNLGWDEDRAAASIRAALELVGLEQLKDKHPYDLTPNFRKRLALASVLAMDPPVLILDEPTTGQDYPGVQLIGSIVDALHEQRKTVIGVTHDIDFCAEHFDRVVVMAKGRVILDGPARSVLAQAEILAQTDVEPPQLIRLANRLRLDSMPLNIQEFISQIDRMGYSLR
jgi:energy-coupling factor transport system ATP-binding protein